MAKIKRILLFSVLLLCVLAGSALGAGTVTAKPTSQPVYVLDELTRFESYNINGNNYFKLRDLAMALNGSEYQFQIDYSYANNSVSLTSGRAYTPVGGELSIPGQLTNQSGISSPNVITIDGERVSLTAYLIKDNNYIKLRDLCLALDIPVYYDQAENSVLIGGDIPTVIWIDAGHGGTDSGSTGNGLLEKNLNITVANEVVRLLRATGFEVVTTRTGDETISLTDRMNQIRNNPPSLVVSVHHNAFNGNAHGAEVLAQVADLNGGPSTELAELLIEEYVSIGQTARPNAVVHKANSSGTDYYGLLRAAAEVGVPAVISEFAFIDSTIDLPLVNSQEALMREAQAIYRAICRYYDTTPIV